MRISDWSSDVCSSDLLKGTDDMLPYNAANDTLGGNFLSRINMDLREAKGWSYGASGRFQTLEHAAPYIINAPVQADKKIGRASCRERVCQYVSISVVAVSLKKK